MTFKVRKRLAINRAAPAIKLAQSDVEEYERRIETQRAARTKYKLELAPLKREYLCLDSVPKTKWPFLKAAGGSTTVADALKNQIVRGFSRLASNIENKESEIARCTRNIEAMLSDLQQAKFRLRRAETMFNPIVTLDTDQLDSDLSVCDDYVNGSIKLKVEEWLWAGGQDMYRITYQTPELVAHSVRGRDKPRVISPINVDITMGSRNHHYVRFRSVNGLSSRYSGYGRYDLLHPHMTSASQPCLGDFSGPIQDATEDYDIVTLVTLVGMFLRQFDPRDAAGSYYDLWPEYVPEPVIPIDSWQRTDGVSETLDDIFADEDRCESDYADEYVRSY